MTGRPDDDVAASIAVLRSIVGPDDPDDEEAWRRVGGPRSVFLGIHLLQLLLVRALDGGRFTDAAAYAADARNRAKAFGAPRWLVEGVCRASVGEPHLLEGIDPDRVLGVAGFLVRDLVDVLAPDDDDLGGLIERVAGTPVPAGLVQPS